jgi:hypothetical protein
VGGAAAAGTPWWSSPQHAALPPEPTREKKQIKKLLKLSNEHFFSLIFIWPHKPFSALSKEA